MSLRGLAPSRGQTKKSVWGEYIFHQRAHPSSCHQPIFAFWFLCPSSRPSPKCKGMPGVCHLGRQVAETQTHNVVPRGGIVSGGWGFVFSLRTPPKCCAKFPLGACPVFSLIRLSIPPARGLPPGNWRSRWTSPGRACAPPSEAYIHDLVQTTNPPYHRASSSGWHGGLQTSGGGSKVRDSPHGIRTAVPNLDLPRGPHPPQTCPASTAFNPLLIEGRACRIMHDYCPR